MRPGARDARALNRWDRAGLYWHTLRHLRPVQFYGRLWFRLHRPRADTSPPPPLRAAGAAWTAPARREPSLKGPHDFVFLGQSGRLEDVKWDGPQREKLWRYNQHYFDDLNAAGAPARLAWHQALLADWVQHNPPGPGNAWEPYPTSLRIVNWVKWSLAGQPLSQACLHSLATQVRWLRQRLERHLLGNHLFANAKALVFAGLHFDGPEAQGWLDQGLRILRREVKEQVLPDGGHFERSTMYHALALEDMLDLCNAMGCQTQALSSAQRELAAQWRGTAALMQQWLQSMRHPDGEFGFFNDAALGVAPSCAELDGYARRMELPDPPAPVSRWLDSSGYARLQNRHAVVLLDMAPVGPDYLPGHAHADTLSFELSLHSQRVLVNSGTSCYGASAERLRQRGTAAHNTVVVDGQDSSQVWSGFRVARRARPLYAQLKLDLGDQQASCAHDGYRRLPGAPMHGRHWRLTEFGLRVQDEVHGPHQAAQARYHFHPGVRVEIGPDHRDGRATLPDGREIRWQSTTGKARLEPCTWHPRFGQSLPTTCLVLDLAQGRAGLQLNWSE